MNPSIAFPMDLHTHSTASDGTLSPAGLVALASDLGVKTLALTDHDCTDGVAEAQQACENLDLQLVPGSELSVKWQRKTLHIVALSIDVNNPALRAGLRTNAASRDQRALEIGRRLAKQGVADAYEGASALAGGGMITRAHFARHLVESNFCPDLKTAFKRWLGDSKPANVSADWASMEQAIEWINGAGGIAVLAHPASYRLTGAWMRRLLDAFAQAGGKAMEVVSGNCTPDKINTMAGYARRFDLAASVGSDFHTPENPWVKPGRLRPLPKNLIPVWELDEFANNIIRGSGVPPR